MDLYEEVVHFYLTVIEGCAVTPQVPILRSIEGKEWYAYPDFLALNFKDRLIQIVEVTKATDPKSSLKLAAKLRPDHRDNVEHYIKTVTLDNQLSFEICWRLFVRRENMGRLKSDPDFVTYEKSGGRPKVMALEDVFDAIRVRMP